MAKIYLSSSYEDLKEYRRVVFEELRKFGHEVTTMEEYVAKDQPPMNKCRKIMVKATLAMRRISYRYAFGSSVENGNPKWMLNRQIASMFF